MTVCLAFFEDSTRTRTSFELAARRVGASVVSLFPQGSSMSKGETLLDTLQTVVAMQVDLVVVRHRSSGAAAYLARHLDAGVLNAGDGAHEHPTQGLLDLLTLRDAWNGRFEGRRVAIVGDLAHSRVARSAIHGLRALGASVTVAGPPALVPPAFATLGCELAPTVEDAMRGADAVMALRVQRERMERSLAPTAREYARCWGVNAERVALMKPHAVVLHPGPFNREVEIASEVVASPRSMIQRQVEIGAAIRCAVLERSAIALDPQRAAPDAMRPTRTLGFQIVPRQDVATLGAGWVRS
jgi:aspartate carbamoyltransferase catalytic subunit